MEYKLSYILTTYNKLPYLKQVMERLVAARQADEEIVVCDGASTDGTQAYLQDLAARGLIQQLVSEPDRGEAHGFNKAMLMAKGELLKIVTDDDAFCYPAIADAKIFMGQHPEVDVLLGNTGLIQLEDLSYATLYEDVAANFQRWLHKQETVWMIGLSLLIRRRSLSVTGLFNPSVVQVDTDFTYRITSLNINIAWSTALMAVRIENPQSNFRLLKQSTEGSPAEIEAERLRLYYTRTSDRKALLRDAWLKKVRNRLSPVKRRLFSAMSLPQYQGFTRHPTGGPATADNQVATAFEVCDAFMTTFNARQQTEYFYKTSEVEKTIKK